MTMLATVVVMPGGLMLLLAVALVVVAMRTARGQRLLLPLKRRLPPRLRAHARKVLSVVTGEKLFLGAPSAVHTA